MASCVPSCDVTARRRRDHVNRLVGQTLLIDGSALNYVVNCAGGAQSDGIFVYVCMHRTSSEWVNPGQYGLVVVTSSEGRNLPYGKLEDILTRDSTALNCHTNDDKYTHCFL